MKDKMKVKKNGTESRAGGVIIDTTKIKTAESMRDTILGAIGCAVSSLDKRSIARLTVGEINTMVSVYHLFKADITTEDATNLANHIAHQIIDMAQDEPLKVAILIYELS